MKQWNKPELNQLDAQNTNTELPLNSKCINGPNTKGTISNGMPKCWTSGNMDDVELCQYYYPINMGSEVGCTCPRNEY